jgi:hypothetical protein
MVNVAKCQVYVPRPLSQQEVLLKMEKKKVYLEAGGFSKTLVTFTKPRGVIVSKNGGL